MFSSTGPGGYRPPWLMLGGATLAVAGALLVGGCGTENNVVSAAPQPSPSVAPSPAAPLARFASKSGTIQISPSDRSIFVLNAGTVESTGSLSIFEVRNASGADVRNKLGQVNVGNHPESVSVNADNTRAYVSNGSDNSVTVIDLSKLQVLATIPVGSEPRGTALSPSGRTLFVANFSDSTVSVIDTSTNAVTSVINLGQPGSFAPHGLLVTNNGDANDSDETLFISDFWGRPTQGRGPDNTEGFDDGRQGRIARQSLASTGGTGGVTLLNAVQSGFTQDRTLFTPGVAPSPPFKNTFAAPAGTNVTAVPAAAFYNQIQSLEQDPDQPGRVYCTSIAAQPEPPNRFNVNVQAHIGRIGIDGSDQGAQNLNALIAPETQPADPSTSLTRAFMGDTVDMAIRNNTALFVSRAGSYLLKATVNDADGSFSLNNNATTPAVRIPTGNIPNGVVMSADGRRAYANNQVDRSFSAIDLTNNVNLGNVPTAELPSPGTLAHNAVIGELVFFTGMGVDVNNLVGRDVRTLGTHAFRNRASDNNWSSCASCHYQGLTDNVTWIFATGPRSVISMDASYSKANPARQRVFNWNAVQGSTTDFNNNSRNIQGGIGFTPGGNADATSVYNHGPAAGVSQALDLMTLWLQVGVRSLNAPSNLNAASVASGRQAFAALNCANCHGGEQWTTSAIRWNRPVFPNGTTFTPLDARVKNIANTTVITGFQVDLANNATIIPVVQRFTDAAGNATSPTLDLNNPIEIRNNAQAPVGAAGSFNPPSLLSLSNTGPYGHHGRAQTIEAVFAPINQGGLGHPVGGATPQQLADLSVFLRSIDGRTAPFGAPNATADN